MKIPLACLTCLLLLASSFGATAQVTQAADSVVIYGAILDAKEIVPVPYASVKIKNKPVGAVTDSTGAFVIKAVKSDTLLFSAVGFKQGVMVLPSALPDDSYTMIEMMVQDTLLMDEVVILSYPTMGAFREAFFRPEDDKSRNTEMGLQRQLDDLLYETYKDNRFYYDQLRYNRLYQMHGIMSPNNFINPAKWANFVRDWRSGKFATEAPIPDRQLRRGINLIDDDQ